jgi:uncharacterized phage-associated protein
MIKEIKNIEKIDSLKLSEYILYKGGAMSHLKLQKILYYIQAYHLGYFEMPLIDDEFEAWVHGPVSRKLYNNVKGSSVLYKEVGYDNENGKENPEVYLKNKLTEEQVDLIDDVINELKDMSGFELESLTHSEAPWLEAREGVSISERCENIISQESMKEYYKQQLYGKEIES